MTSTTAAGSSLAISTGTPATLNRAGYAALAYDEVGFVDKIGVIGRTFGKTEFQALRRAKDKLKGATDYGALTPSMAYDETDAGQITLRAAADDKTTRLYPIRVTYATGEVRYFRGRVFGAPETIEGADAIIMTTATIEICTPHIKVPANAPAAPAPIIGMTIANTAKIRAAMNRTDRNAIVAALGPSTTAGQSTGGGADQAINSWPVQASRMLRDGGIASGSDNVFFDHVCWGAAQSAANYVAGDNRVTLAGSAAPGPQTSVSGSAISMNGAAGSVSFQTTGNVTKFDIWVKDGSGRNFSWQIDGGAATTITGVDSATRKFTVSAGTAGRHTITINWVAGNVQLIGLAGYDDTNSRRETSVYNWGRSGARTAQLINNTDTAAGPMAAWEAIAPDLSVLDDWAINDWRQSITIDEFKANLLAGINKGKITGDVVVTSPIWDSSTTGAAANQDAYATATLEVAAAAGVPVIDIRAAWQSYAASQALGRYSDAVHPSVLGYTDKAKAIAYFIQQAKLAA